MKKYIYEYNNMESPDSGSLNAYFRDGKLGVFDIETTGLDPEKTSLILIGFLKVEGKKATAYQYFAENLLEEGNVIKEFLKDLDEWSKNAEDLLPMVTYNGARFDVPFMEERMRANGIEDSGRVLDRYYDFDLYQVVRYYSPLKEILPNLRQKTVEEYMGFKVSRSDEISGAESIGLYFDYVRSKDEDALEKILLHNRDDILQLYRLLAVLKETDLHKYFFRKGVPCTARDASTKLITESIRLKKHDLEVSGRQLTNPVNYTAYSYGAVQFDGMAGIFRMSIPMVEHSRMDEVFVVDLTSINIDTEPFEKYPQYSDGLLILKRDGETFELQINMFIREFAKVLF